MSDVSLRSIKTKIRWWHNSAEILSVLLEICGVNPLVTDASHTVYFIVNLNELSNKQSNSHWFRRHGVRKTSLQLITKGHLFCTVVTDNNGFRRHPIAFCSLSEQDTFGLENVVISWTHDEFKSQLRRSPVYMASHDDGVKWKHFPRYWPFVRGIHRSPVNSPHKGQWRGALRFSLICTRINGRVNNLEAGDLRCHSAHYDVM